MAKTINIRKGLNISLQGAAVKEMAPASYASTYAVVPGDFHGLTPKVVVKAGDKVKAGTPLIVDKKCPEIAFVSPVSGEVKEVVRGEKRKLLRVTVTPDDRIEYQEFPVRNPLEMSAEEVKQALCEAGVWPFVKRRPYDVMANPRKAPKSIFVKGFDTAPLAPDYAFVLKGKGADIQTALNALTRLTDGKVYLTLPAQGASIELANAKNVEQVILKGVHPAGNVGVAINHVDPLNKGEEVWTVNALDLPVIGKLFNKGIADFSRPVAVTGPEVYMPAYYMVKPGICLEALLEGNVHKEIPLRFVSGNALTGTQVAADGYLGFYDSQVTVLHEGTDVDELLGWVMPRFNRFSSSKSYFSGLIQKICPKAEFETDTRMLGSERALIMSGEYDKVFPMDILPERLLRACIVRDLEDMEALGIYEVAPEDFALCEYVCTSKIEVQKIVREALDLLKAENGDD